MIKVITYGTFDMLHYGHLRLLERAKSLGDYLIVGVTSDDYDKSRGKINIQQSLMERIVAVRETGLADEIIVEEYEGQKMDDIRRMDVDIFTVGSDWEGQFDYLNECCKVIYLPRTEGISSSEVRAEKRRIGLGLVGSSFIRHKFIKEAGYVNGVDIVGYWDSQPVNEIPDILFEERYERLLDKSDAVFIMSKPEEHYMQIKLALSAGKHVLCESPIALTRKDCDELFELADFKGLILMDAIKTAYSTAFERLVLLAKAGKVGKIVSVDAVCTSLRDGIFEKGTDLTSKWNSICDWGPIAMLPVFQILGTDYKTRRITTCFLDRDNNIDAFTKVDFHYSSAVASIKVAKGAKSEGELVISGTKGYIYVPAPWWKTDYFELRYENQEDNKRFFYQLEGEGIRHVIVAFAKSIEAGKSISCITRPESAGIVGIIEDFNNRTDLIEFDT